MWKYVAFVLLIVFSVPAVLGDDGPNNDTSSTTDGTFEIENNTTMTAAVTTGAPPTTPTESPATTTTTVVTVVPTTEATTVPPPPSTTALPPPDIGKYSVVEKDNVNETCLRIEMALRVSIHDVEASYIYNFPVNASTEGSNCNASANTEILMLSAKDPDQKLTFVFFKEDKKNYVQNLTLSYSAQGGEKTVGASGHYFSAAEGNSYLCHSDVTVKMENVTLTFSSLHVQAFGANSFGRAEECDADDKVGDIVPIAVGCALGALVIIVLIAYLVGRRRSHQKGYQSV